MDDALNPGLITDRLDTIAGSAIMGTRGWRGVGDVKDDALEDFCGDWAAALLVGVIMGSMWSGMEGVPWRETGREGRYTLGMCS